MSKPQPFTRFLSTLRRRPDARAFLSGSDDHPDIRGTIRFYQTQQGVLVAAEVAGLPSSGRRCENGIFAFHIHRGHACTGNADDPFADALTHYDPERCPHPAHAGDMPPLFSSDGAALQVFLTDRFTVREILGRTVILHGSVDDFTTQPGGNAGTKIACGEIRRPGCR